MSNKKNTNKHGSGYQDELPPVLKDLQGQEAFKVPEGYFNNLPGKIRQKAKASEQQNGIIKRLLASPLRIAAAVLIFLMIGAGMARIWINEKQEYQQELTDLGFDMAVDYGFYGTGEADLLYFMSQEEMIDSANVISDEVKDNIIDHILAENRIESLYFEHQ